jgi:hypothetical protein
MARQRHQGLLEAHRRNEQLREQVRAVVPAYLARRGAP